MEILEKLLARAKANPQRIVLPEGDESRTLQAADIILQDAAADIYLLGNPVKINALANELGLNNIVKAHIIDPENNPKSAFYANLLYELRKNKGMTLAVATEKVKDPLYLACLMIKNGDADGELAGARSTTGNVLRPALQIIKTLPGISVVSGACMLFTKEKQYGADGRVMVADMAVMPNPSASELAQIAVCTGQTMRNLVGLEPRIAMLSFSTKGSASHEFVDKVVEATALAQKMAPDMEIDGELQADAALVAAVGEIKCPGSHVAGHANTLVCPTLEVGNIAYKLVQRLGGAEAIGPILQGIAAPVNDLSRGCSVSDVVKMILITSAQAMAAKK